MILIETLPTVSTNAKSLVKANLIHFYYGCAKYIIISDLDLLNINNLNYYNKIARLIK